MDIVADTQVVVLMGGLGTRLGLQDRPKAMADIDGIPFFDYQLRMLKRWRFHKFLFLVGYQADKIEKYYGNGERWQVAIQYSYDGKEQLGTGGALRHAKDRLEDAFLLIYGDSFMDIDYQEVVYRYRLARLAGKKGLMTILKNEDHYDKSNVIYQNGELVLYDKDHRTWDMKYIDYGVSVLSKELVEEERGERKFDLAHILTEASKRRLLEAHVVQRRFYEIGSPAAKAEFCAYARKRFGTRQKAVFLDRDGVINELVYNDDTEWLDSPFSEREFRYVDGVLDALRKIGRAGYYIFIVTNQPAAAKGKTSLKKLYDLNAWLTGDLKAKGIAVEFVNMCPHYPGEGKKAELDFLNWKCDCRKPEAGMIRNLLEGYGIDRENSYMVGDSYTDILAGKSAGIKTVFFGKWKCDMCQRMGEGGPDHIIDKMEELAEICAQ